MLYGFYLSVQVTLKRPNKYYTSGAFIYIPQEGDVINFYNLLCLIRGIAPNKTLSYPRPLVWGIVALTLK